jgi:WD40 repeat protein
MLATYLGNDVEAKPGAPGVELKRYEVYYRYPAPPSKPLPTSELVWPYDAEWAKKPKGMAAFGRGPKPAKLLAPEVDVMAAAVSPDGKRIAISCYASTTPGKVQIRDAATGEIIQTVDEGYDANHLTFSPDSSVLACGDYEGMVRLYDAATGALTREIDTRGRSLRDVVFVGDHVLTTCLPNGDVQFWDTVSGARARTWDGPGSALVEAAAISTDGTLIALGGLFSDGQVRIVDYHTGETARALDTKGRSVKVLAFSPDGKYLAIGFEDGKVSLWRLDGEQPDDVAMEYGEVGSVAFSPDGRYLAVGSDQVRIHDLTHVRKDVILPGDNRFVAFMPDGRLVTIGPGGGIAVWSMP